MRVGCLSDNRHKGPVITGRKLERCGPNYGSSTWRQNSRGVGAGGARRAIRTNVQGAPNAIHSPTAA